MPPFQKGHKLAKGGARPGAGRKSKADIEAKNAFLKAFEEEANRRKLRLVTRYFDMTESDPTTMRHFVDKHVPNAKQEIEHSGVIVHEIESPIDWDKA